MEEVSVVARKLNCFIVWFVFAHTNYALSITFLIFIRLILASHNILENISARWLPVSIWSSCTPVLPQQDWAKAYYQWSVCAAFYDSHIAEYYECKHDPIDWRSLAILGIALTLIVAIEVDDVAVEKPGRVQQIQNAVDDIEPKIITSPTHNMLVVHIHENQIDHVVTCLDHDPLPESIAVLCIYCKHANYED